MKNAFVKKYGKSNRDHSDYDDGFRNDGFTRQSTSGGTSRWATASRRYSHRYNHTHRTHEL
jgi:hypothetical protein